MNGDKRTVPELLVENEALQLRLEEAEETLRAIQHGEIDALLITTPEGKRVYTLEGAERPYRVLLDTMNEGAITVEPGGDIGYCNAEFAAMLGRPLKTVIGTRLEAYVAPADTAALASLFADAGTRPKIEVCLVDVQGRHVPVQLSSAAVDLGGAHGISIVVTDLTQQKRNEEIVASEKMATSILEEAGQAIIVCDKNGRIFRASRMVEGLCGQIPLHRDFDSLFPLSYPDGSLLSFREMLSEAPLRNLSMTYRRSDGRCFSLLLNAAPLHIGTDELVGAILTLSDVTELKQVEEALARAKEEAEAASHAKSQFLANMSHEIRTPMAGVMGMIELALEEEPSDTIRDYLRMSHSSAKSLLRILNDVLDTTKIEAGKLEIVRKPFILDTCISSAVEALGVQIRQKKLDVSIVKQPGLAQIITSDEIRLRQILVNLLGNAVKFTNHGSIVIRLERDDVGSGIVFRITDTGIGIPQNKLAEIFEAFIQADLSDTRRFGGTGLGLTLCRQLVKLMGGRIWVESEEGCGSTFSFHLPLCAEGFVAQESDAPGPEAETVTNRHKILIADDDPVIRDMLTVLVKRKGFNPVCTTNGRIAVDMWTRERYALILMDIQMPEMDGFAAVAEIRKKEKETGRLPTPIIAVTARAMREEEETILDSGFDGFISKPINFDTLHRHLAKYTRQ